MNAAPTMLEAAQAYRAAGWRVHPLTVPGAAGKDPGKRPLLPVADRFSLSDEELFRRLISKRGANLGLVPGTDGHWIVDLDSKPDRGESVRRWLEQDAPEEVRQQLPREATANGAHLHFRCTDPPEFRKPDGQPFTDRLIADLPGGVTAELFWHPSQNVVLSPSQHPDGARYRWENAEALPPQLPEKTWAWVRQSFGFVEPDRAPEAAAAAKKPGRPKSERRRLAERFRGDLASLDLVALLRELGHYGKPLGGEDGRHSVRCPWRDEHSDAAGPWSDADSSTVIWMPGGDRWPGFRCAHSHCHERKLVDLLTWSDDQRPGVVDRHCARTWAFEPGQKAADGRRPRLELPGAGRPEGEFAAELGAALGATGEVLLRVADDAVTVVRPGQREPSGSWTPTRFHALSGEELKTYAELHVETGAIHRDAPELPPTYAPATMPAAVARAALVAPQLKRRLPRVCRLLEAPLFLTQDGGTVELPRVGYDARFGTYLPPEAPTVDPLPLETALGWLDRLLNCFPWQDAQSRTHAAAFLVTPAARGLMGFGHRPPLWMLLANRPRAGKDYFAGVRALLYGGEPTEDPPIPEDDAEFEKRLVSAILAGRSGMHLANVQRRIESSSFIGACTAPVLRARLLGGNSAAHQLALPNELEFSLSGNLGLSWREDVTPRARIIRLAYFEEDANQRAFPIPDLHGYVRENRAQLLGAVHGIVAHWIRRGRPAGPTPFASFRQWGAVVGGILAAAGLGDPCLPDADADGAGGDPEEAAMRALFGLLAGTRPGEWVDREAIEAAVKGDEGTSDDLLWLGLTGDDPKPKASRQRLGRLLKKYRSRTLGGVRLDVRDQTANYRLHTFRFARIRPDDGRGGSPETPNAPVDPPEVAPDSIPDTSTTEPESGPDGPSGPHPTVTRGRENLCQQDTHREAHNNYPHSINSVDRTAGMVGTVAPGSAAVPELLSTRGELSALAGRLGGVGTLALDLETWGPAGGKNDALSPERGAIRLLSLAWGDEAAPAVALVDVRAAGAGAVAELLGPALRQTELVIHSARFDCGFLLQHLDVEARSLWDTLTASKLLTNGTADGNSLAAVVERHLGQRPDKTEQTSDWGGMFLTADQLRYAAADAGCLLALRGRLEPELAAAGLERVFALEMACLPAVVRLERTGVLLDRVALDAAAAADKAHAARMARAVRDELGAGAKLNVGSPQQLLDAFARAGCPLPNTAEETLAGCEHPAAALLLEYRGATKRAAYAAGWAKRAGSDGRLRARFNPLGAETGRFSSQDPNLQNVERGPVRCFFVAPENRRLVIADFSGMELRAAAALAGEERMLEAFATGKDLHRLTAAALLSKPPEAVTKEDRQLAKAVNFGLIYGSGAAGLQRYAQATYGLDLSEAEAARLRTVFFETYPGLADWHRQAWERARAAEKDPETPFAGRTRWGRRRTLEAAVTEEQRRSRAWLAFQLQTNHEVQGGCADVVKLAMGRVHRRLTAPGAPDAQLLLTVHDELVAEAAADQAAAVADLLRAEMEGAFAEVFPEVRGEVEVAVGDNWGAKK